jgi:hypothetical protein
MGLFAPTNATISRMQFENNKRMSNLFALAKRISAAVPFAI